MRWHGVARLAAEENNTLFAMWARCSSPGKDPIYASCNGTSSKIGIALTVSAVFHVSDVSSTLHSVRAGCVSTATAEGEPVCRASRLAVRFAVREHELTVKMAFASELVGWLRSDKAGGFLHQDVAPHKFEGMG